MTEPIQLERYRNKQDDRGKQFLLRDTVNEYSRFLQILTRQLNPSFYREEFSENEIGEQAMINLLNLEEKNLLDKIGYDLFLIVSSVRKRGGLE